MKINQTTVKLLPVKNVYIDETECKKNYKKKKNNLSSTAKINAAGGTQK